MTIRELRILLDAMDEGSKFGDETCVYVCVTGVEYVEIENAKLDKDDDGVVALLITNLSLEEC